MKRRLDQLLTDSKLTDSRSQAENYIKLGYVTVDGLVAQKPGQMVGLGSVIKLNLTDKYVSRAGFKLASVANALGLDFKDKTVLDVGSSTGGFTDFALQKGASKVIAVDVGTEQLHPSLRINPQIDLRENTDIRDIKSLDEPVDLVVIDVSFISLRDILPHVAKLVSHADIVAMLKPQFESGSSSKHKGVIKNDRMRRDILKDFEAWAHGRFVIVAKADSEVSGAKGNLERFYLLRPLYK
jgi:23S rRNA (cytidine1920-2'-O)/16S rRNA (cytidine1409-2'-O)-methyltransferase